MGWRSTYSVAQYFTFTGSRPAVSPATLDPTFSSDGEEMIASAQAAPPALMNCLGKQSLVTCHLCFIIVPHRHFGVWVGKGGVRFGACMYTPYVGHLRSGPIVAIAPTRDSIARSSRRQLLKPALEACDGEDCSASDGTFGWRRDGARAA